MLRTQHEHDSLLRLGRGIRKVASTFDNMKKLVKEADRFYELQEDEDGAVAAMFKHLDEEEEERIHRK